MYYKSATSQFTDDYINIRVVFGETSKNIFSKNFKGGKIQNFFGSTELDLTHADLSGTAILDISQVCGSIEIIVPRDWRVQTNLIQFCSVVEDDRRYLPGDANKMLILIGTSDFASVEISSY